MSGWTEIMSTQRVTRDGPNHRRGIRVYRVWGGYARTQILEDPTSILNATGQPLPGYKSSWAGMLLDAYDVQPLGPYFDATALYSNTGAFHFPTPPTLNRSSWTGGFQTGEYEIPYARWESHTVTTAVPNGPPIVNHVNGWEFDQATIKQIAERIGQRVYLDPAEIGQALDAMYVQTDKLHKIRGRWYHFEGGDYSEMEDGKWEMNYSWTHDPGTRVLTQSTNANYIFPSRDFEWPAQSGQMWVRPPFHKLIISQTDPDNPQVGPTWDVITAGDDSDPTGWSTLPRFRP